MRLIMRFVAVQTDPEVEVVQFELEGELGTWCEAFGCREEALAFLRGLRAALEMAGVPHEISFIVLMGELNAERRGAAITAVLVE